MASPKRFSFNAGEISPELRYRSDLAKYHNACARLEDFLVTPTGAVRRRKGARAMRYLGEIGRARLLPFEFSEDVYYCLLLAEREGVVELDVIAPDGTLKARLDAPWPAASLDRIQFVQSYDVLLMVHPEVHPMRLERQSDVLWELKEHPIRGGPYEDLNVDTEKKVRPYVETWLPGKSYAVGDYACENLDEGVDGLDSIRCETRTLTALSENHGRTWTFVEGNQRFTRTYRTIKVRIATTAGNLTFAEGAEVVALNHSQNATVPSYDWGIYLVAAVVEESGTPYVYLHTDRYTETVETYEPETGWGAPEAGTDYLTFTGWNPEELALSRLRPLDEDRTIYRCVQATTGEVLSNGAYWEEVSSYGGVAYVAADAQIFREGHVEGLWRWVGESEKQVAGAFYYRGPNEVSYTDGVETNPVLSTNYTRASKAVAAYGKVSLRTEGGTWRGILQLQESIDGGATWSTIGTIAADGNRNGEIQREVDRSGTLLRCYMEEQSTNAGGTNPNQCRWYLEVQGQAVVNTEVEALLLESGELAQVRLQDIANEMPETFYWSFGRFSPLNGYPRAITLHEERMVFGGTEGAPSTICGSAINDWEEFQEGTLATSPIQFTLASDQSQQIAWLRSQQDILIGLESGEWALGSRSLEKPLSGETVSAKRHSSYGSAHIQAIPLGDVVVNVQRGGKKLRGLVFSYEVEGYQSTEMTAMANHIAGEGFAGMAATTVPETILWGHTLDGQLVSFTFDRAQEVSGWARHLAGHPIYPFEVRSLTTTPGVDGSDYLWLLVRLGEEHWLARLSDADSTYLDLFVSATHETRVASIDYVGTWFEYGEVYGDKALLTEGKHYTVSEAGGTSTITIAEGYDFKLVEAGLDFGSTLKTTAIDLGDQSTHGKSTRATSVTLYVVDSFGGEVSTDGGLSFQAVQLEKASQVGPLATEPGANLSLPKPLYTGAVDVRLRSGYRDLVDVELVVDGNNPFTLCALGLDARRYE